MAENKLKHLEFIQNTITRMSTNSFIIKGWLITLISASFVLSAKDSNNSYIGVTLFATPIFWFLNGYFLCQERRYRSLYNKVRLKKEKNIDFSMDASQFNTGKNTFGSSMFSVSIYPLYIITFVATIIILMILKIDFKSLICSH
ncbi:hypothetical protein VB264_22680 [Arcicella aquatica]|uniref:DUF4199 domain-containing protein n=1 Tax=Arcicella aquatica TaxID=217141 RepID=A0ABU5QU43_9BACT|nr:hypothetical protein [Arcicella aquatica]MEA5260621.1 hypothetical protein [Arcicella aquatica]